jgi:hypothetical protein
MYNEKILAFAAPGARGAIPPVSGDARARASIAASSSGLNLLQGGGEPPFLS